MGRIFGLAKAGKDTANGLLRLLSGLMTFNEFALFRPDLYIS